MPEALEVWNCISPVGSLSKNTTFGSLEVSISKLPFSCRILITKNIHLKVWSHQAHNNHSHEGPILQTDTFGSLEVSGSERPFRCKSLYYGLTPLEGWIARSEQSFSCMIIVAKTPVWIAASRTFRTIIPMKDPNDKILFWEVSSLEAQSEHSYKVSNWPWKYLNVIVNISWGYLQIIVS